MTKKFQRKLTIVVFAIDFLVNERLLQVKQLVLSVVQIRIQFASKKINKYSDTYLLCSEKREFLKMFYSTPSETCNTNGSSLKTKFLQSF